MDTRGQHRARSGLLNPAKEPNPSEEREGPSAAPRRSGLGIAPLPAPGSWSLYKADLHRSSPHAFTKPAKFPHSPSEPRQHVIKEGVCSKGGTQCTERDDSVFRTRCCGCVRVTKWREGREQRPPDAKAPRQGNAKLLALQPGSPQEVMLGCGLGFLALARALSFIPGSLSNKLPFRRPSSWG